LTLRIFGRRIESMQLHNFILYHEINKDKKLVIMEVIKSGRVRRNGELVLSNVRVTQYRDQIELFINNEWTLLEYENPKQQIALLYKPRGYLCTHYDPHLRPTIYSILPLEYNEFQSAGRLDQDSEGLLLISNDGRLLISLMHPSYNCQKEYLVGLERGFGEDFLISARAGGMWIDIDTLCVKLKPIMIEEASDQIKSEFEYLNLESELFWYKFTLKEGKKNQIRRMSQNFGNKVVRLIRTKHGKHELTKEIFEKGIVRVK
jgi:23S rRNA pseudouridine2605 synthase